MRQPPAASERAPAGNDARGAVFRDARDSLIDALGAKVRLERGAGAEVEAHA